MEKEQPTDKRIETLVQDIYGLFQQKHKPSQENLNKFAIGFTKALEEAMLEGDSDRPPSLRMSNIGKPDRQLWYTLNTPPHLTEKHSPTTKIKFLLGSLYEELVLFLAREAGHKVEGEQREVEIKGVKGHQDCIIDGTTIDIKTASNFSFDKFAHGTLKQKDYFGYIGQISGYTEASGTERGGFLAMNKESGELALLLFDKEHELIDASERIDHIKEVVSKDEPPEEKCYPPTKEANGNEVINTQCSYCPFKELCWKDANNGEGLRVFKYKQGRGHKLKFLSKVKKKPNVEEITSKYFKYE